MLGAQEVWPEGQEGGGWRGRGPTRGKMGLCPGAVGRGRCGREGTSSLVGVGAQEVGLPLHDGKVGSVPYPAAGE